MKLSQSISTSAARGAVEKWLLQVQDTMIVSVKDVIEQARDVRKHTQWKTVHVAYAANYQPPNVPRVELLTRRSYDRGTCTS